MELKVNVSIRVPVRLRAVVDGSPLTGVTFNQVTVYVQKQAGAAAPKVIIISDWTEIDATNMPGEYDLLLSSGDVDTLGFLRYFVSYAGISLGYSGLVQVVANIESDTFGRIGGPISTSISADLQNAITSIKGASNKDLSQVDTDVTGAQSAIQGDIATINAIVSRTLALSYDNVAEDTQVYDGNGKLTSSRVNFYNSPANAVTNDGITGLLYQYAITATYDGGGNCTLFRMVRSGGT